jgi:hypothetical protein
MEASPRYAKRPRDASDDRRGGLTAYSDVELRVTLGDMDLEDAFRVTLPASYSGASLGELLDRTFCEDEAGRARVRSGFDLTENPDLPEMYEALVDVFNGWRDGRFSLRLFVNHGPEAGRLDPVGDHIRSGFAGGPLLDLIIEQRNTPLDYAVRRGHWPGKKQLLEWLSDSALLYSMDRHGLEPRVEPATELDRRLLPVAEKLRDTGVLRPSAQTGSFEITAEGRQVLADMIAETESYLALYDIYEDVRSLDRSGPVEFGTGHGEDLRVQVYEAEGLDPLRVVFLLLLYDGTLDSYEGDWREAIQSERFYDHVLAPVVDRPEADDALIESIIESGLTYLAERDEESAATARRRELLARAGAR